MSRYKIIKTEQPLDDNEILQSKDFRSLLHNYERYNFKIIGWRIIIFIGLLIGSLFIVDRYYQQSSENKTAIQLQDDTVANANKLPNKPKVKKTEELAESTIIQESKSKKENSKVATADFRQAAPKAGYDALYNFFNKNLNLPDSIDFANEIDVMVACTISKNGKAANIEVLETTDPVIQKETIRLVSEMPEWHPAIIEGDTVASRVSFSLKYIIK